MATDCTKFNGVRGDSNGVLDKGLLNYHDRNDLTIPLRKFGYENGLSTGVESDDSELQLILNRHDHSTIDILPGSKLREEARKELQLQSQRPNSLLYNQDDLVDSQKIKNILNSRKDGLNDCSSNGAITDKYDHNDDKRAHHVQFNRNILKGINENDDDDDEREYEEDDDIETKRSRASPSISTSSSSSSSEDSSLAQLSEARPPDGGWGWVVVAAAFMVNLIADGITFSFGVIFHEFLNYFGEGKAATSWVGSLFMAMPLLSGPIASFLTDRYGCKRVTIAGSILAASGFVISYFATSMWMLILTFGVLAGFGLSLCFVAAVVVVAYYFDKKRSFATGLSVCGSGIGTFIFPPLIQRLLSEYGWRGTTLILAGLFLNLAVCGCLMRDLPWTKTRAKVKNQERRLKRERKRLQQNSSGDSFSGSSSANTAQTLHGDSGKNKAVLPVNHAMIIESLKLENGEQGGEKLFSSLVNLPTFLNNGEHVPLEVLELLSNKKNVYNVLLQNYPSLMISSRSFSDSSGLHEQISSPSSRFEPAISPLAIEDKPNSNADPASVTNETERNNYNKQNTPNAKQDWWVQRKITADAQLRRSNASEHPNRLPTAYLKDIRVHRHSLTYRGAMLNINRYRLRASSCPDIYRNSMTTIAKEKMLWYSGLREFWELLVDMLDFSHFADSRFLLFSISNFLLHFWYDVPYMYLTDNAIEVGFSETQASYLISVIGISNMAGEILMGWAGDQPWINASMVYAVCMALCGAFAALIPTATGCYYLLCAIAGAFGFFIAANYSLTSIILVEAITLERFTNAYGLLLLVQGIANLMGPPLAGWLGDVTGSYNLSFYLAGMFVSLSGMMLMVMPLMDYCQRIKKSGRCKKVGRSNTDEPIQEPASV